MSNVVVRPHVNMFVYVYAKIMKEMHDSNGLVTNPVTARHDKCSFL